MKPSEHQRDIQHEDVLGKDYARGHYIFREGDMCDALYIIQRGKVRIFTVLPFGQEVELALVGPGEVFGITSLF
ncbi:MAG: cyclic nucleotide-binding domain-containing protein, partial [bacterium]